MTDLETLFREKYPNIDTLVQHSPRQAKFLALSFLYNNKQTVEKKETEESKVIPEKDSE